MASGSASLARARASARISRPSASVLSTSTVLPLRSGQHVAGPGGVAAAHVVGHRAGSRRPAPGRRRHGTRRRSPSTAAAPPMSIFMVIMPSPVLSDRPPESKVMPLPTRASVPLGVGRLVGELDEPGLLDRALVDAEQAAEAALGDLGRPEHLDGEVLAARRARRPTSASAAGVSVPPGVFTRSRARLTASAMRGALGHGGDDLRPPVAHHDDRRSGPDGTGLGACSSV